ncbi:MAG: hypothetical protein HRT45_09550 [Bdellovibrionales bacterium]|nr:hypothetical protein [Bdellovibrionales bacterium]
MPSLQVVSIPGAPCAKFFDLTMKSLWHIRLQACDDSQRFIFNMANSELLSQVTLDFTDVWQAIESPEDGSTFQVRTQFEDYKTFFTSMYLRPRAYFTLRDRHLSRQQILELQQLNPDLQFLYVPIPEDFYVSHLK